MSTCARCTTSPKQKLLEAGWHLSIAALGVYEFHRSRTFAGKVLGAGLILFHLDATIGDWTGQRTITRDIVSTLAGERRP